MLCAFKHIKIVRGEQPCLAVLLRGFLDLARCQCLLASTNLKSSIPSPSSLIMIFEIKAEYVEHVTLQHLQFNINHKTHVCIHCEYFQLTFINIFNIFNIFNKPLSKFLYY